MLQLSTKNPRGRPSQIDVRPIPVAYPTNAARHHRHSAPAVHVSTFIESATVRTDVPASATAPTDVPASATPPTDVPASATPPTDVPASTTVLHAIAIVPASTTVSAGTSTVPAAITANVPATVLAAISGDATTADVPGTDPGAATADVPGTDPGAATADVPDTAIPHKGTSHHNYGSWDFICHVLSLLDTEAVSDINHIPSVDHRKAARVKEDLTADGFDPKDSIHILEGCVGLGQVAPPCLEPT